MEGTYALAYPIVIMLAGLLIFEGILWSFVIAVRFVRRAAGQPE